jgi:transposase
MYIESIPNRTSPPAVLLRESFRENGKVKKRTLANLSCLPANIIEGLRILLAGGKALPADRNMFSILRSWPHGHVAAVLGVMRNLGFDRLLGKAGDRMRDLIMALIVCRLLDPASKLATARMLNPESAANSLPEVMQFSDVSENDLYSALDWLVQHQPNIERTLAGRHLNNGTLVLYDVSSSYVEGHSCELAQLGYSRDGKKGTLQIVYGLLCSADGCPVAVEVFDGNTADPKTLSAQIIKLKERFHLAHVILFGDRGMITQARIDQELKPAGLDWISALRGDALKQLFAHESFQLSLFEERDLAGITTPEYPGERLILCRNPELSKHRAKKREDLLCATEAALSKIAQRVQRTKNPLSGKEKISLAVGKVIEKYKMSKHFALSIEETSFSFQRKVEQIAQEAALDGIYCIRTSVPSSTLSDPQAVSAYKSLSQVERAFRSMKTTSLEIRPIYHWRAQRVRGHVLLCMLAYYVEWHMRKKLAPLLYDETDHEAAASLRDSPVSKAQRSPAALRKERTGRTEDGLQVLNFRGLLKHLSTYSLMRAATPPHMEHTFLMYSEPTPIQKKAFELLHIKPDRL